MPKLIIDEQKVEVPPGTKVIDAAEKLGIVIPRFCYHPALGSVGACRVCAVKFIQGPVNGVQMSCMVDAQDDMVVSTTDDEVVDFRRYVIEWLMLNHPHDCPVCDEGGQCLLQDLTIAGGHGSRRFQGRKRTHRDQYLGPLIQHEMNRCIQCYRCSRFYQEFTGYRDLGVMQIGRRVYFGRYQSGILQSPFAGNLADICPTGVYTDKPSRFTGRRWDYQRSPSICINCSLGCHILVSARYRQIVRQEANFSEAVNGHFICDRGRYGFFYAGHDQRPRRARVDGEEVPWETAVAAAAGTLRRIGQESGPGAVACLGSTRSSLETLATIKRLCQINDWRPPAYWFDRGIAGAVNAAVAELDGELSISLRDLERADYILAVGVDPINEAPMLALAMRQAQRRGAKVTVVDPRPVSLPFPFSHLPLRAGAMDDWLTFLIEDMAGSDSSQASETTADSDLDGSTAEEYTMAWYSNQTAAVARDLDRSLRPAVICGTEVVPNDVPRLTADLARHLRSINKNPGLFYLLNGANAFGAALLSDSEASLETILGEIENNSIRALIVVESDPCLNFYDRSRLQKAFGQLDLLVVLDYLDSDSVRLANVFLPTMTVYEAGGIFVNQEGRAQLAPAAFAGGRPIVQVGGGEHPPRSFRQDIPGQEAKPAQQALTDLVAGATENFQKGTATELMRWLIAEHPEFSDLMSVEVFPQTGLKLSPRQGKKTLAERDRSAAQERKLKPGGHLELITVDWTFGTEELSVRSPHLGKLEREPCLLLSIKDASRLGIIDGDKVVVRSDTGTIEACAAVVGNMASGTLVLPRHHRLDWQHIEAAKVTLSKEQVYSVKEDQ